MVNRKVLYYVIVNLHVPTEQKLDDEKYYFYENVEKAVR